MLQVASAHYVILKDSGDSSNAAEDSDLKWDRAGWLCGFQLFQTAFKYSQKILPRSALLTAQYIEEYVTTQVLHRQFLFKKTL